MNRSLLSLVAVAAVDSGACGARAASGTTVIVTPDTSMTNQDKNKRVAQAAEILNNSDIVCFDVDSTVIREEGIDELARYCGKGTEVARLTKEAMKGSVTFQDALKLRLDIIRPTQRQIREFIKSHPSTLSPGIKDLVNYVRNNGSSVYLISGGFDCLIEPVAIELGIPLTNVFANKLLFYFNGEYAGFDTNQPTSRSGGKGDAILQIRQIHPESNITMVGDGATDLEASPPANNFIGYGGNVVRNEVQTRAQYYVTDFRQLMQPDNCTFKNLNQNNS
ncbi:unnamed protein product [Hermetia illucens]|uniref:Phosphoserine phosphatase n=1 Tax=Hermetia illucens TaxID=343691 RepID=A0A7R8YYV2_HERIL|nr:phosphoserine phosphatase isoform X2 [Hermetia illucens]CAD7089357.1 unnamed protein product [Hermetia illucens]